MRKYLDQLSSEAGFIACGVATARRLDEEEGRFKEWLARGYQGGMGYLERNLEKRLDPRLLVPGAKSVITFLYNYYPAAQQPEASPKIARYAWGEDYHKVIKDKLYDLVAELQRHTGKTINGRVFTDSAPVMERQWAALSGLGWLGKNSLLLRKGTGSWFFIGCIICDLELEPDAPATDHCGSCTACIDACPTQAIVAEGVVDANRCISYLTIEKREELSQTEKEQLHGWIFGCDICQEVCPWNSFSQPHAEPRFTPSEAWPAWNASQWENLSEADFNGQFGKTPLTRAGFDKIRSHIAAQRKL